MPFIDVIKDVSGGNKKVKKKEYQTQGIIPVVDQGKTLIGGYTNNLEDQYCKTELPVIIFGDHTRIIKFINQPFAMGADGVKVLKPKTNEFDEKFLYHYLRQVKITDGGYDRHYKYLKRISIPFLPLPEQNRIAEILDKADALREKRRISIEKLDELAQSVFLDMFGDPETNPKGWQITPLEELIKDVRNGLVRRRKTPINEGQIVLRLKDVREGWIALNEPNRIDLDIKEAGKYLVEKDDFLFVRVNGNPNYVGRCALFIGHNEPVFFNDHIMRIKFRHDKVSPIILSHLLNSHYGKTQIARYRKTSAGQHTINQNGVGKISVYLPPIDLQKEFIFRLDTINKQKKYLIKQLNDMSNMFLSLQQKAFRGELMI